MVGRFRGNGRRQIDAIARGMKMNISIWNPSMWVLIATLFVFATGSATGSHQAAQAQIPVRWTRAVGPPSCRAPAAKLGAPVEKHVSIKAALVSRAGGKRVRVVAGEYKTILDLSKDVSGCLAPYDSMQPRQKLPRYPLGLKVIDSIRIDNTYYLVIAAGAMPNCNIQGECGAADNDITLIWLKMNEHLHLQDKQAVLIDACRQRVRLVNPVQSDALSQWNALRMVRGELAVDYEAEAETADEPVVKSHLAYDRKAPERGLVIRAGKPTSAKTESVR
jgi:hypothetical protein